MSKMRHRALLEGLRLSRAVFESVSNGITISDATKPDLPLIYVNPGFEKMTGYLAQEVYGRNCRFLQGSDNEQPGRAKMRDAIREGRGEQVVLKNYRKDGTQFWNELSLSPIKNGSGYLTHFVGFQTDVTARIETALKLDYLAHHDSLTGLVNRRVLLEQLKQALLRSRRTGGAIAVLFFDLDNFKQVNDVLGHDAGDRLLQIIAKRLTLESGAGETVARLGGMSSLLYQKISQISASLSE